MDENCVHFGDQWRSCYMDVDDAPERFTRLLIECEPELLRSVLRTVPNRADARDILQECSVALWRRFADYDSERPFVAWAFGFVRMEVRRFLRKSQRRAQLTKRATDLLMQDQQQYSHELDERDLHLKHCFKTLAEDHRKLLDGYYHKGHSVSKLSEQNGRSIEAIYKRLQRIRIALHRCIELRIRGTEA
ncbi:MAG TPA: sigma-70 family RNA polymerase sigma factor [Planctomycetes bacterium]|nr:sigma-70 family RNA polymerase sigma factor [Planctomycetota bacterium]